MWGLMSPIGKAAMNAGISSLTLTSMRMMGAAILFWIASMFTPKEKVSRKDFVLLFFAAMLSIVCNQGLFIYGLSLTSPVDASIITTALPIITMILAAAFLKEPLSKLKIIGVVLGTVGALTLILSNNSAEIGSGNPVGSILCLMSQISFACYLTIFKRLILKYSVFTLMRWMFTYASIVFIPFSYQGLSQTAYESITLIVWLEVGYVVLFGTFFAYMMVVFGQKILRPTTVSMYNYVQPIIGAFASVVIGLGTFGWDKGLASILIFAGVYMVTQSNSLQKIKSKDIGIDCKK